MELEKLVLYYGPAEDFGQNVPYFVSAPPDFKKSGLKATCISIIREKGAWVLYRANGEKYAVITEKPGDSHPFEIHILGEGKGLFMRMRDAYEEAVRNYSLCTSKCAVSFINS